MAGYRSLARSLRLPGTCVLVAALLFGLCGTVFAHPALDRQIEILDARIAASPGDPGLLLKRGELHRLCGEWQLALADYRRARRIDHDLDVVELLSARVFIDRGHLRRARRRLERFVARHPAHTEALSMLGRLHASAGRPLAAAEWLERAIDSVPQDIDPSPGLYLERAEALGVVRPPRLEAALQALDEGIGRLGPVVSLELPAVRIEADLGRYDAALSRLSLVQQSAENPGPWLERRASILLAAGREEEAVDALSRALDAVTALPSARRGSRDTAALERRVRASLQRLSRDGLRR